MTMATSVVVLLRVTVGGTTEHVICAEALVQPSCTVPVKPSMPVKERP